MVIGARIHHGEITAVLAGLGFNTVHVDVSLAAEALERPVALCLIDLSAKTEALRLARAIRSQHPRALVLGIADPARPSASAEGIRAGMFDVLSLPPSARDLEALIANAKEQAGLAAVKPRAHQTTPSGIVGSSAAMRVVMDLVRRAASGRCGILICGERGTGRETIARAIHAHAANREAPFVKVDCSGSSVEDVELQLFGVINSRRSGHAVPERRSLERLRSNSRLCDAAGGVLFLENLVELPARAQARLVRVLRDHEVFLDDLRDPVAIDIRPIASVDTAIDAAREEGRLRQDLFERLSPIRIDVPALRQRREDIPMLAAHFLRELCRTNDRPMNTLTRPAMTLLSALPMRGNLPELRALLERLVLLVPHGLIRLEDVLAHTQLEATISPMGFDATLRQARARFERDYIGAVLQHHRGRVAEAAKVLGIQRTNLYRKIRRLNVMRVGVSARDL